MTRRFSLSQIRKLGQYNSEETKLLKPLIRLLSSFSFGFFVFRINIILKKYYYCLVFKTKEQ